MEEDMKLISEYIQNERKARVLSVEQGFDVEFYKDDQLVETREIREHNVIYAEDCAENWVMKVIA
jgi:hypothetical protein